MLTKLKILGTYSPYPKGIHNCPGFLVISDSSKILLDCGNGILSLLSFPEDLINLSVIISHMHNDHFGDLGALQYASYTHHNLGLINEKITIYLPSASNEPKITSLTTENFSYVQYKYIKNHSTFQIGDILVTFLKTSHSEDSYAIRLEDFNSTKIVYTSDISYRDKEPIIKFAQNADILICESSFVKDHGFPEFCSHLTAEQAANIAKQANVNTLILTHFWPEEDVNKYLREAKRVFYNSYIAVESETYFF